MKKGEYNGIASPYRKVGVLYLTNAKDRYNAIMISLVEQKDIITYVAIINEKKIVVYEFENDFVIYLHLEENRLLSLIKKIE